MPTEWLYSVQSVSADTIKNGKSSTEIGAWKRVKRHQLYWPDSEIIRKPFEVPLGVEIAINRHIRRSGFARTRSGEYARVHPRVMEIFDEVVRCYLTTQEYQERLDRLLPTLAPVANQLELIEDVPTMAEDEPVIVDTVEALAEVENGMLTLPDGRHCRLTSDKRISVFDAIAWAGWKKPFQVWERLCKSYPEVSSFCGNFQFAGQGQRETPITDAKGFRYIAMLLPGKMGIQVRTTVLDVYERYLAADPKLAADIVSRGNIAGAKYVGTKVEARMKKTTPEANVVGLQIVLDINLHSDDSTTAE